VSKERKLRRAAREAEHQQLLAARARADARRRTLRGWWRRISWYELRQRRTGRLFARRSAGERALVAVAVVGVLFVIWKLVPSLALSVALTLLLLLSLPVLVIVAFDRRSS
jgi:hypothetical protein